MFGDPTGGPFGSEESSESRANPSIPEAQNILQGLLAELPEEAQVLVDKVNREIARIQEKMDEEITQIREQAEKRTADAESKSEKRRKGILQHTVEQLEPLQKELFRNGELGKALAIFVLIQMLKARALNVLPDPGTLLQFEQIGKSFHFQVAGTTQGPVWGTDTYTSDSHLATAAVHAGALEAGEEGVVRVSVVDMSGIPVRGSMRNGVMTMDWGPYRVGYRLVRI
jgi:hypothetical protein